MTTLAFYLGLFGSLTSTVFTAMVLFAAIRFVRRRRGLPAAASLPAISVLKPLHGSEPGLEAMLESFFQQDYPEYEILFCARHACDAGLQIAKQVAARYPLQKVQFLTSGEPPWPNARCYSLEVMRRHARHGILAISDSDVKVRPEYLRALVPPFQEKNVGLVTCLYRGVTTGGPWAQLEALGMSVEMTSGVLVAEMLEGMRFALGPTMVVRRSALDAIGGFTPLGQYHADDFMLGNMIAATGSEVVLSTEVIEHHIVNCSFRASMKHQLGWMKSTRFSRPLGHLGTVLTFATPFGILAAVGGALSGHALAGLLCLAITFMLRVLTSAVLGAVVVDDTAAVRLAWLYPVRDMMGFFFWMGSYFGRTVRWRDDLFRLGRNGVMQTVPSTPKRAHIEENSRERAV